MKMPLKSINVMEHYVYDLNVLWIQCFYGMISSSLIHFELKNVCDIGGVIFVFFASSYTVAISMLFIEEALFALFNSSYFLIINESFIQF